MGRADELLEEVQLESMPYKRARTESIDRSETANSVASRLSQSPPHDCAAHADNIATPHAGDTFASHQGSVSGLSPDEVDRRGDTSDAQTRHPLEETTATAAHDDAHESDAEDGLFVAPPVTSSSPAVTEGARAVLPATTAARAAPDPKVSSTAFRVLASRSAPKPHVKKAVTTLHSLEQLERLLAPTSLVPRRRVVQPIAADAERPEALKLYAGETVMFLVHQGKDALNALVNEHTVNMSMMRIYTLDVAALPPQDYEVGRRTASLPTHAYGADDSAATTNADEKDEEETLITPVRPQSFSFNASPSLDLVLDADSLSNQLQHATDPVMARLTGLFQVDTSLCPWLSFGLDGGHSGASSSIAATQKAGKDMLPMPAMVVWRAPGAPHAEYPPAPPQTYSSQPMASQPVQFPERMTQQGGPLVVKEVHTVDQVHSLSLWQPVYTLPHLLHTVVDSIRAHPAHCTGDTARGRSVIYLGASWCPPCMRIVSELPLLTAEGLPPAVHTWMKADMDFAKPIFDFFKVEIIPTFIVLENAPLLECERTLHNITDPTERREAMEAAFTKADLGHLQNSSRPTVSLFIEKNSKSLSFDEDF